MNYSQQGLIKNPVTDAPFTVDELNALSDKELVDLSTKAEEIAFDTLREQSKQFLELKSLKDESPALYQERLSQEYKKLQPFFQQRNMTISEEDFQRHLESQLENPDLYRQQLVRNLQFFQKGHRFFVKPQEIDLENASNEELRAAYDDVLDRSIEKNTLELTTQEKVGEINYKTREAMERTSSRKHFTDQFKDRWKKLQPRLKEKWQKDDPDLTKEEVEEKLQSEYEKRSQDNEEQYEKRIKDLAPADLTVEDDEIAIKK